MKIHFKKGFTLVELLVAIAIMVIISGIILANYRTGQKQQTLKAEAQKLTSTLRQAQNMAMAQAEDPKNPGQVPPYGYGVYAQTDATLKSQTYFLLSNYGTDDLIDDATISARQIELVDLSSKNINITWPKLNSAFIFRPPQAVPIKLWMGASTSRGNINSGTCTIILSSPNLTQTFSVKVNLSTGQISLE